MHASGEPDKYAEVLLGISQPEEHYTSDRIRAMYGKSERTINFKRPIPVYITYQTAFVDDAGTCMPAPTCTATTRPSPVFSTASAASQILRSRVATVIPAAAGRQQLLPDVAARRRRQLVPRSPSFRH